MSQETEDGMDSRCPQIIWQEAVWEQEGPKLAVTNANHGVSIDSGKNPVLLSNKNLWGWGGHDGI